MDREDLDLSPSVNPYAPTTEVSAEEILMSSEEMIRRKYIRHETGIKSIAGLFILAGLILFLIAFTIEALGAPGGQPFSTDRWIQLIFIGLGTAQIISAFGIYRFSHWGRWSGVVISAFWMLAVGPGTFLSFYFLYLLLSRKATYIFSTEYQQIREMTPELRYKMTWVGWLVVIAFLMLIFFALFGGTM